MHKINLDPQLVARLTAQRGGKLHTIDRLDPRKTAHIIVDMQNGFVEPGAPVEVPLAREIVPNVNRISQAVRKAGSNNFFVQFTTPVGDLTSWSSFYSRFTQQDAALHQDAFTPGAHHWQLWPKIEFDAAQDRALDKLRFGAFIPRTCDLDAQLRARGIDTLIITGTLTNCCCESTARDALQMGYKVIFMSDANATLSDEEHLGTLLSMYTIFADVMDTPYLLDLIEKSAVKAAA